MHPLLQRQWRRSFGDKPVPSVQEGFIEAVNRAYLDYDADRDMLERSLELSSQELLEANSELKALIQAFPDIFMRLSPQGKIMKYQRTGCSKRHPWSETLVGADFGTVIGERYAAGYKKALQDVVEHKMTTTLEFVAGSKGIPYHYESRLIPMEDDQIFVIIRDITERKQAEEQLIYYTMFDPLTNLHNRAFFEREMQRLEGIPCNPLGFIICDVDNLKIVNDTYGHNKGDLLLMEVANLLHNSLRKGDIVARIGGDEFAIILPDSNAENVESTCARIRAAIAHYNKASPDIPISISMGYSVRTLTKESMEDIFKQADDNMYKEKFGHHKRLGSDLVRLIAEVLVNQRFIIEGTTKYSKTDCPDAVMRFEKPGSNNIDNLDIVVQHNRDGDQSGIFLSTLPTGKTVEKYRAYLKAVLLLINMVLESLPDRKMNGNSDRSFNILWDRPSWHD